MPNKLSAPKGIARARKAEKRDEADARDTIRAKRSAADQVALLKQRRGQSAREVARLTEAASAS